MVLQIYSERVSTSFGTTLVNMQGIYDGRRKKILVWRLDKHNPRNYRPKIWLWNGIIKDAGSSQGKVVDRNK